MKTYLKSILAIIMIAFCACEKDPTFEFRSIDDNATKVSNITATSADVTFSIIIAQSGRFSIVNYNYADDYVEVYYSTSSNPFIEPHKCVRKPLGYDYTGTNTVHLSNLEPETTYYYAIKWRKQGGEVRSFKTPLENIEVTTGSYSSLEPTSVTLSGSCVLNNGTKLEKAGILIKLHDPDISISSYDAGTSGTSTNYSSSFTGLYTESTYYYRAYAKDSKGKYYYGEVKSFKTPSQPVRNAKTAVDLGLSVKWAAGNVGATYETDYGNFYAWGETNSKSNYSWSTYKWCNGSYYTMTKYCTHSDLGKVDNKTTLDLPDDAAHVNWGGSWRMPTKAEQDELRKKCTWTWTTLNGVNGYLVTSKKNGNSIFLPASGCYNYSSLSDVGSDGGYWSSSLDEYDSGHATYLGFSSDNVDGDWHYRSRGYSVRPVCQ